MTNIIYYNLVDILSQNKNTMVLENGQSNLGHLVQSRMVNY